MSWMEDERYKELRKDLEDEYRILGDFALGSPETRIYEFVLLEMKFASNNRLAHVVANLVTKWLLESNPYYIDKAVIICAENKVEPLPPTLMLTLTDAASRRYSIGTAALKTTSHSIERDDAKWRALTLMMNLIYHGITQDRAGRKASRWMQEKLTVSPIKASTLDKYYLKEVRNTGLEKIYFDNWGKWIDDDAREQWLCLAEALPEAEGDLVGVRRE